MNIYYTNGEVVLEGGVNVAAFEIRYKGRITAESELPDNWIIANNDRKIIGVNIGGADPQLLFTYTGELRILSCKVTDINLNQENATPKAEGLGFWGASNTKFEDFTQHPENHNGTYSFGSIPSRTSINHINLITNQGEWFYENGTPYYGDYHTHGSGQSMTGSKHTKDSKNIYRKDAKGNIFKLSGRRAKATTSRQIRTASKGGSSSGGGGY